MIVEDIIKIKEENEKLKKEIENLKEENYFQHGRLSVMKDVYIRLINKYNTLRKDYEKNIKLCNTLRNEFRDIFYKLNDIDYIPNYETESLDDIINNFNNVEKMHKEKKNGKQYYNYLN